MQLTGKEVEDTLQRMREKHYSNAIGMWVLSLYGLEIQGLSSNHFQENVIGVSIFSYIYIYIYHMLFVFQLYFHSHPISFITSQVGTSKRNILHSLH